MWNQFSFLNSFSCSNVQLGHHYLKNVLDGTLSVTAEQLENENDFRSKMSKCKMEVQTLTLRIWNSHLWFGARIIGNFKLNWHNNHNVTCVIMAIKYHSLISVKKAAVAQPQPDTSPPTAPTPASAPPTCVLCFVVANMRQYDNFAAVYLYRVNTYTEWQFKTLFNFQPSILVDEARPGLGCFHLAGNLAHFRRALLLGQALPLFQLFNWLRGVAPPLQKRVEHRMQPLIITRACEMHAS